ncbi:MAG: efflux RND transporter periplasmic adaptor subunit, partial [Alphaproteobacteria bacterium]|nr:efflux RND transporter periplasmic adaptor subunit [Alphaproteobacteria bacterium]
VAQPYSREIVVRGHTQAVRWVDVRAEQDGRVVEVLAKEGERVKAGAPLVRLDMEDRAARLGEAQAWVEQRQIEFYAARELSEQGYRARTKLAEAQAQLESAYVMVARMEEEVERTEVRAPFDGILEERATELGDFLMRGAIVARVVDQDPYLVAGQVTEQLVGSVAVGAAATARLITGESATGRVRYVASMADPSTRTFRVEVEVPNSDGRLRDGVTAELRIVAGQVAGHLVSPAVLTLDDKGVVGVRLLNGEGRVELRAAKIIGEAGQGVWLGGLPETIDLIVVGQEFVRDGEMVPFVRDEAAAPS